MPLTERKKALLQSQIEAMDWECVDDNTRYLTHGIHRYSGKFIPQVARQVITILTQPEEIVCDPYCGSGTTLLEALMLGRRAIGIDMNPLALLIARTKCTPISRLKLDALIKQMTLAMGEIDGGQDGGTLFASQQSDIIDAIYADPRFKDEWYLKWFSEKAVFQLIGIHRAIMFLDASDCRNLALTAFSDILRRCSYAHSGYPNVMYDKRRLRRGDPLPLFVERLREFALAVAELERHKLTEKPYLREGDARETELPDDHVDAIITHPPYIGSIPYAEYGALSLTWLGHDPKCLDLRLTGGKRQAKDVLDRFQVDYGRMLQESFRILKPGKYLFVLVGHPLVKGKRIDLSEMTRNLAEAAGFSLAARTSRTGINRRANKMGDEDLLFFQKPI